MNPSKSIFIVLLSLCFFSSHRLLAIVEQKKDPSKEKLIFAIDVIRHGDRNPIIDIPAVAHNWPEGLGGLTPLGMRQEYELGKKCRNYYINQEKLLPPSYQHGSLYVRSTDVDRTLMSATCFLMGLYPPGSGPTIGHALFSRAALPHRFQPIPIHTAPHNQDGLLNPEIKNELQEYVFSTREWRQKINLLKPRFAAWSRATGVHITSEQDAGLLGDALFILKLKHIPLPHDLSQEEAEAIITQEKKEFTTLFNPPAVGKAAGGPLLQAIGSYLEAAAQCNNKATPCKQPHLKYLLYSAHDNTVLALMSALGTPLKSNPPYASDVKILLFEEPNHSKCVRLLYNEKPILLPSCDHDGYSPLESFLKLAKPNSKKK